MTEVRILRSVSHKYYNHQHGSNINFINITITRNYSHQEEQYIFIRSPQPSHPHRANVLVAFIFPAMVEFMQLMYQASDDKSPFQIHPKKMFLAIASFLIYCFSYDARLRLNIPASSNHRHYRPPQNYYVKMVEFVGSIFGPLTLASYSSLIFPSLGPILYSVSFFYSVTQLLYTTLLITQRLNKLYHKFIRGKPAYIIPF
ncbi:hypothetical protein HAX54_036022 [Datura stramonium]|uniref:Uncharacterized protein n=1 Tax=Datura stramonium TaxID=4076 RepID=A0ABS8VHE7_DATST|nr:hypothetical protein [Datura stramonium]